MSIRKQFYTHLGYTIIFIALSFFKNTANAQPEASTKSNKNLAIYIDTKGNNGVSINDHFVQAFLSITNKTNDSLALKIEWNLLTDDWVPVKQMYTEEATAGNETISTYCPLFQIPHPGFYRIMGNIKYPHGETIQVSRVFGMDPEKIIPETDPQPDFGAFWKSTLNDLKEIAPDHKTIPWKREGNTKTNLYKVEMKSLGGLT